MYGRALAQTVGTAVIRLADAELLPYSFTNFSETVKKYLDELQKLAKSKQDDIRERNKEIEEGVFAATADPKEKSVPPSTEELPPYLNFAPLQNAVDSLLRCSERYDMAAVGIKEKKTKSFETVNAKLIESERKLTTAEGLPGRPWFRHQIYAPGFYTGYGVKTIPAVREAIDQKQWKLAEEQVVKVARVIEGEASLIDSAATELEKLSR
jgi:N-acetylated-alpha-linked acidic dipeptidase